MTSTGGANEPEDSMEEKHALRCKPGTWGLEHALVKQKEPCEEDGNVVIEKEKKEPPLGKNRGRF